MCVSVVDCTYFFFVFKKVVGWSVSREHQQRWNGSMAANLRGSGACQHFLHSRSARLRLSHHCLQFTSGQDPRRQAHSARYVSFELSSIYRLCKDLSLLCFFPLWLINERESVVIVDIIHRSFGVQSSHLIIKRPRQGVRNRQEHEEDNGLVMSLSSALYL